MTGETNDQLGEVVANLPLLLLIGGLAATVFAILSAAGIVVLVFSALFGIPEFQFDQTTYDGVWTLFRFGPVTLLLGGVAGAIAYGTWKAKAWTRTAVIVFWTLAIASAGGAAMLYPTGGSDWIYVALGSVPMLLVSWLYLYFWSTATKYYAGLTEQGADDEPREETQL